MISVLAILSTGLQQAVIPARWLAIAVWACWLSLYWIEGARLRRASGRSLKQAHTRLDLLLIAAIVLVAQLLVWTGIFVIVGRIDVPRWAAHWAVALPGTLAAALGAAGSFYSRRFLGPLWAAGASLQPGHHVVDSGPYCTIRHPIYAAVLLMYLGTTLVFFAWWTALSFVLLAGVHIYKLLDEEAFLTASLQSYRSYRQRVRYRLIPGIW